MELQLVLVVSSNVGVDRHAPARRRETYAPAHGLRRLAGACPCRTTCYAADLREGAAWRYRRDARRRHLGMRDTQCARTGMPEHALRFGAPSVGALPGT